MPRLAIHGGPPVAPQGLLNRWPRITEEDLAAVQRVLKSGVWGRLKVDPEESEVGQWEAEWAAFTGAPYSVAVSSGTAALEVALKAVEVGPGDEVIVPAVTYIATATAVILAEAVPVVVDVDPHTFQLDPEAAEAALTERTRALLAVHYGGYPADLDRLTALAERRGVPLIEDCAHAHGTEWRGRHVGTWGTAGAFSFQANKALTCGEGGTAVLQQAEGIARAFAYHSASRVPGRPFWDPPLVGPNYRLGELPAALLRSQLRQFLWQRNIREDNGEELAAGLEEIGGLWPLPADGRITRRGYFWFVMRYEAEAFGGVPRDRFVAALRAEGIPVGTGYGVPVHHHPALAAGDWPRSGRGGRPGLYGRTSCPVAERFTTAEQVTLDHPILLEAWNVERILEAVAKLQREVDELRRD